MQMSCTAAAEWLQQSNITAGKSIIRILAKDSTQLQLRNLQACLGPEKMSGMAVAAGSSTQAKQH